MKEKIPPIVITAQPVHGSHSKRKCTKCSVPIPDGPLYMSCREDGCPLFVRVKF